jgi:hypothetical protein
MNLPAAGASCQNKEVIHGGDAAHVENDNVARLVIGGHAG